MEKITGPDYNTGPTIHFPKQNWILAFSDSEHLGPANRAYALCCWFAVLHGYLLGILNLSLGTAFDTVSFHMDLHLVINPE